jgi:hypothetical protein
MYVERLLAFVSDDARYRVDHFLTVPIPESFAFRARGNVCGCAVSLLNIRSSEDPLKPALCFAQARFEAFAEKGNRSSLFHLECLFVDFRHMAGPDYFDFASSPNSTRRRMASERRASAAYRRAPIKRPLEVYPAAPRAQNCSELKNAAQPRFATLAPPLNDGESKTLFQAKEHWARRRGGARVRRWMRFRQRRLLRSPERK